MAAQSDKDWQSTKKKVLERSCYMFNNPLMSDIIFTCGQSVTKEFYAHKYVLATSSLVFYSMFYGDSTKKDSSIDLPEVDEEILEEFLRFLYTDECSKMTLDVALKLMYLANKYNVAALMEKCVNFAQAEISPENVFPVLENSIKYSAQTLVGKCWELVEKNTRKALFSKGFLDLSQGTLSNMVNRDDLRIEEVELFDAVLKWSDHKCELKGKEITCKNRRSALGDAVYQLRILSMTQEELSRHVIPSGLLTNDEKDSIKISKTEPALERWSSSKKRYEFMRFVRFPENNIKVLRSKRFSEKPRSSRKNLDESTSWNYSSKKPDKLRFTVDKPVVFHGVRLFGSKGHEYKVNLKFNGKQVLDDKYQPEYIRYGEHGFYGFDVMLQDPVDISVRQCSARNVNPVKYKSRNMKIEAFISGPKSDFGIRATRKVKVEDVSVVFRSCKKQGNGTDRKRGQFCEIILGPP